MLKRAWNWIKVRVQPALFDEDEQPVDRDRWPAPVVPALPPEPVAPVLQLVPPPVPRARLELVLGGLPAAVARDELGLPATRESSEREPSPIFDALVASLGDPAGLTRATGPIEVMGAPA